MITIGYVRSPYLEKFAVPRQPGLAKAAIGHCDLVGECGHPEAVRGLGEFSHIWVIFEFHQTKQQGWKPLVRPPRLGGNRKVGVFASRSTYRPNSIGMSLVKIIAIDHLFVDGKPVNRISVEGLDLVDGTPILDIKPYLAYAESVPDAKGGYADSPPPATKRIVFGQSARDQLAPNTILLIEQVLQQDPRPAYQRDQIGDRIYGVKLDGWNIRFRFATVDEIEVVDVLAL
ncbi:tRNA (N6-threonylcarbamoyladenosine(37)-N6)-methyltransferase TrmO [Echinimonas agarilytica]|nr:tRNA (N6-threonylcarbamoyladenosine(37)-N6)-methyltransferase TrmO [Echinimonas agarilytica]